MPENWFGWAMFVFFAGGAAGGWLVLLLLAIETWKSFRKTRPR